MRHEEAPTVGLDAGDARTVREAGAAWGAFTMALAEQGDRLRRAVTDAGHGPEQARLAAARFEAAARDEWARSDAAGGPRPPVRAAERPGAA